MPVAEDGRVGRVTVHHVLQHGAERAQRFGVQRGGWKDRRKAGGLQQGILAGERQDEPVRELQHHRAARPCAAGFEEGEVARRDIAVQREV